ncbi:unnamed protein product [Symbiodinium sp. CCMP2592]|nr:unnamed protein product [Symbiodinium sp. CCMP2592]
MARRALAAALALAVAGSDPEPARRLQFDAEEGGWMRIGEDDQQCYVPGGMDIHEGKSREYCRKKADEAGWEYYQYNEDKELCAMTDMCEKSAMTFDATGWKSYGKNWCVRCGESLWVPKRKSKQCCESNCFSHYWWTPYGATVDCGGGNLTVSLAEAQKEAKSHV